MRKLVFPRRFRNLYRVVSALVGVAALSFSLYRVIRSLPESAISRFLEVLLLK